MALENQGPVTDKELVARALAATTAQDRTAAFEAISERHYRVVLTWCGRWLYNPGAAQDVGHEAFAAAFDSLRAGKGPTNPGRLGGWLIEFARHRLLEYVRRENAAVRVVSPEDPLFENLANDESDAASAERREYTRDLVGIVVGTLTQRQQQVYRLVFVEELTGKQMAPLLGVTNQNASNQAKLVKDLIGRGVNALVLAQEGRGHCARLDAILDEAGFTGGNFTAALRERVVRHFDTCDTCDKCRVCAVKREQLTRPYMPVLIPLLFGAEFRERIAETIHVIAAELQPDQATKSTRRPGQRRRRPPRRDRSHPGQSHPDRSRPDEPGRPGRTRRRLARRSTWYGGAAAALALVVLAVLLVPHSHPAAAAHQLGGGSGGSALTADETAARVSAVPTGSAIAAGPLLGPDGRLWSESVNAITNKGALVAVNPVTYASTTYPLPGSLDGAAVWYPGAAAFDGGGHLWLSADLRTGSGAGSQDTTILLRYTPGSGTVQRFAEDSSCATDNPSDADELYSAPDGAVWVMCQRDILGGGALYYEMSPGGAITGTYTVNNAQPGSLLYLAYEELPSDGTDGPLAPGPGGTMWALDSDSFIELNPSGLETLILGTGSITPFQLVGNGTNGIESVGTCIVNNAQGEQDRQCVNLVNPDGTQTTLAYLPDYDGYNNYLVHWAVMDRSGNVWLIIDGTAGGRAPHGQYYVEVSPGGTVKVFPFTVPGDTDVVPVTQARPVLTPNGGLWTQDRPPNSNDTIIQIIPK